MPVNLPAIPSTFTCKFGNRAVPGSGVVRAWVDLNDRVSWNLQSIDVTDSRTLQYARQLFAGSGVRLSGDFGPKDIKLALLYDEGPGVTIATAKAQLTLSGEQWLTLDGTTQTLVECSKFAASANIFRTSQLYDVNLDLIARNPWSEDMAASTVTAFAVNGSVSPGSANVKAVTYNGALYGRPTWTLVIPSGNTAPISKFVLANTTSGEALTVTFPLPLAASTAWTITIDCLNWKVTDQTGLEYDMSGSFPVLYGPPGTVNSHTLTLTTASGTSTGVTLAASWLNRWELA